MLKVVLADDEPYIVQGISMIIDWEQEGFEIVGVADNGLSALEIIKQKDPDLVIADIMMPQMTGLELLEKVRTENVSDANFVILSGYSEFDYAKTAMKYGSLDYLLKPLDKDELLGILEKVRESDRVKNSMNKNPDSIKESWSTMVGSFLRNFESQDDGSDELLTSKVIDRKIIDSLIHAVETNQKEEITMLTATVYSEMEKLEPRFVTMGTNYLIYGLIHLAADVEADINQQEILRNIARSAFEDTDSSNALLNLNNMLIEFSEYLVQLRGNQSQNVLSSVEADIRVSYKENLTLKDFGKKYFVNSAYLGQMFKKQYGISFKDYLNDVRVDKAKELLLNSDMKVNEIASEVGYNDVDYFINRFIARIGCTPARFRKMSK